MDTELNHFYYLVFQAHPMKDKVYYWVDGSKAKRTIKRQSFIDSVDKDPNLKQALYDACDTTSFFLFDNVDAQILKLNPKQTLDNYSFPLSHVFHRGYGSAAVNYDHQATETLDDHLNELGFEPIDATKIKNLQVALVKVKKDIVY